MLLSHYLVIWKFRDIATNRAGYLDSFDISLMAIAEAT